MLDSTCNLAVMRALNPAIQGFIEKLNLNEDDCIHPLPYLLSHYPFSASFTSAIIKGYTESEPVYVELMRGASIKELLIYLSLTHTYYLNKKLPEIEQSLFHILNKQAFLETDLIYLSVFFNKYRHQLEGHIRYEEEVFFPYVQRLLNDNTLVCDIKHQVNLFMSQHTPIEEELEIVIQLMKNRLMKQPNILSFNVLLTQIDTLALDLRLHAIIEEQVLVPKVKALVVK